jgi:pSer/pThr/pTyr-binding forkhead associated (FHA) protein
MALQHIKISVMSGAEDGKTFEFLDTPITIGRHPEDNLCLAHDNRVSRHHARIIKERNEYFIEDVGPQGKGSTNGTFIGENKIDSKTVILSGDMILLGSVAIKFQLIET